MDDVALRAPDGDVAAQWLSCLAPDPAAQLRLVMVPHAGGGPAALRALGARLGPGIEPWSVVLPGRERRFAEPAHTSMARIAPAVGAAVAGGIAPPYALFGHSMGALVAYEAARWLCAAGHRPPERLVVSGCPAPHLAHWPDLSAALGDDALLRDWLIGLGGVPGEVLANPDLLTLLLPTARADLRACDAYAYQPGPPLPCPLHALGGRADRAVPAAALHEWAAHTGGGLRVDVLDGGHFYLLDDPDTVAPVLRAALGVPATERDDT